MGDAGHIHSPVGGQGMNTGLCDAHNLAWKLAMVTSGRCDDALLDTYDAERRPFAERLIKSTDRLFGIATGDNPLLATLRGRVVPELLGHVAKAPAVGPKFFGLISQTRVEYDSVLGAGYRLPWSGPNYAPLRSARPQLHFYGQAPEAAHEWLRGGQGLIELCELPCDDQAEEAGLRRDAGYLVRPDGYVSLEMDSFDAEEANAMLRVGWGLRRRLLTLSAWTIGLSRRRGHRPRQGLRRDAGGRRGGPRGAPRLGVRRARPQRRGQDHHDPHARHAAAPRRRAAPGCWGTTSSTTPTPFAARSASPASSRRWTRTSPAART